MVFLRSFFDSLDPRWLALVVALFALMFAMRSYRLACARDERDRREQEAKSRQGEAAARQHEQFLAAFGELFLESDSDGARRFVWRYPPQWDAPEVAAVSSLSRDESFWLVLSIWRALPEWKPTSVRPDAPPTAHRLLWETDAKRSYRRRVITLAGSSVRLAVALTPRDHEPEPAFCVRCRILVPPGGSYCPACGRPEHELRRSLADDLDQYRNERAHT